MENYNRIIGLFIKVYFNYYFYGGMVYAGKEY